MPSGGAKAAEQPGMAPGPGMQLAPTGGWQPIPGYTPGQPSAPLSPAPFSMANLHMPGNLQAGTMFRGQGGPQNMPINMPSPNLQQMPQQMPQMGGVQLNPQTGEWEPVGGWPPGMGPVKAPEPVEPYNPDIYAINA